MPTANLALPLSGADPSGHMFEGTYLDTARAGHGRVRQAIAAALDRL